MKRQVTIAVSLVVATSISGCGKRAPAPVISGHADERGSDEYNLALGQRRAVAAKRYLVDHGIDATRLGVVSYGEEHPVCTASAEACWSKNRRAEFEITMDVARTGVR